MHAHIDPDVLNTNEIERIQVVNVPESNGLPEVVRAAHACQEGDNQRGPWRDAKDLPRFDVSLLEERRDGRMRILQRRIIW